MSRPKCQHHGCDRNLHIHDRDDNGNIRYRCPMEMNQNYIDWLKSGSTEAEECMKLMDTLRNERDRFHLSLKIAEIAFIAGQQTKCLPTKDSSDSQK